MSKKHKFIDAKRRGFLQGSAALTATAAAGGATAMSTSVTPELKLPAEETSGHAGYKETDRVREYYRKARLI